MKKKRPYYLLILNLNMKNYHIYLISTFFKNLNPITTIWPLFPFQGDRTEYIEHQLTFDWCNETFQCTLGAAEMQLQLIGCSLRKVEPKTFSTEELRTKLREREERSASPSATTKPHSASNYYTLQYLVVQHFDENFFLFHQSP